MSTTTKVVIGIIVIVLIGVGIWYIVSSGGQSQQAMQTTTAANSPDQSAGTVPQTQPSANQVPESGLTTSSSDSSNAALNTDLSSINGQMDGLNSDSAAANQSTQ